MTQDISENLLVFSDEHRSKINERCLSKADPWLCVAPELSLGALGTHQSGTVSVYHERMVSQHRIGEGGLANELRSEYVHHTVSHLQRDPKKLANHI